MQCPLTQPGDIGLLTQLLKGLRQAQPGLQSKFMASPKNSARLNWTKKRGGEGRKKKKNGNGLERVPAYQPRILQWRPGGTVRQNLHICPSARWQMLTVYTAPHHPLQTAPSPPNETRPQQSLSMPLPPASCLWVSVLVISDQ